MRRIGKRQPTLMSKKFYSMLLGGTLTMLVVSALLMADSVIAGTFIGSDAVAGITLVTPLYALSAFFGSVFSLGVPIVYSAKMGEFDKRGADQTFGFGLLMAAAVGAVLFLAVAIGGGAYLQSSSPSARVLAEARGYLKWMRFTILLLPLQMLIAEMVYSDGDETLSTIANAVQGVGNLAASILLSRSMGIRGIGLASFLFNGISLLILCAHFLKKSNSLRLNLYFSVDILKAVARCSIIDASSYLFISILTAVLNRFVSAQFGAGYLILVSVIALGRELQLLFDGIGEAITPILSVYLGEGCTSGVQSIYKLAQKTAVIEGLVVTAVLMLCAPLIPGILDIADPALVRQAVVLTRLSALGSVFVSLLYLLTSYYLLIEKIALGLMASALRDVLVSAPLAVLLGKIGGVYGFSVGLAAAPALAYGLVIAYICLRYGRGNCPIFLAKLTGGRRSELYSLATEPEQIIALQKTVEALLRENGFDKRTVGRVKLLIEELFMLIREKNGGKAVLAECALLLRPEGIQIITRDEGVLFDIAEEDVTVTSIAAFAVSGYMEKLGRNKRYLTTMSFNRSSFLIKTQAD